MARKFFSQGIGWWAIKSATGNTIIVNDHDFSENEIQLLEEIFAGTDRTLIVVSVAYLENYLRSILRIFLIDNEATKRLLDPMGGALSGFVKMADMIFACGLMREEELRVLKALARIRNRFAHDASMQTIAQLEDRAQTDRSLRNDIENLKEYSKQEFEAAIDLDAQDWIESISADIPSASAPDFNKVRDTLEFLFEHLVHVLGHEIITVAIEKSCQRLE